MTTLLTAQVALPVHHATMMKWKVLVGAVMVQMILGTVYGYSVFWQPLEATVWPAVVAAAPAGVPAAVASETAQPPQEARLGYLKYAFAICLLSFATAMIFAGRLQDLHGPRFTALLGGTILGIGFLVAGQLDHLVTFYLCHAALLGAMVLAALLALDAFCHGIDRLRYPIVAYLPHAVVTTAIVGGVALAQHQVSGNGADRLLLLWGTIGLLAGVGIGFAYVCPIAALVKWFPEHKGLVSGVAVAGFGLGAYLFSGKSVLGAVGFIERYGITTFFTVHGLVCAAVVSLGALLLRNPPHAGSVLAAGRTAKTAVGDSTWQDVLRNPRFYVAWMMFFSGAMAGLMVIGILKPFAGAQLVAAAERSSGAASAAIRDELILKGATAVGVLALFNAAGRVVWGLLSDRIGRSPAMMLMFVSQAVTMLSLAALDTEFQLAVGAACVGFNFGGNFALFPSLTADLFGSKNFGANYGWMFTSYGVAGVMGVWAGNAAQRMTGSYFVAFAFAAALCFASAILAVLLGRLNRLRST
ncbi:MAG: OFA family MFS transporter [Planctomycetota bacterium]